MKQAITFLFNHPFIRTLITLFAFLGTLFVANTHDFFTSVALFILLFLLAITCYLEGTMQGLEEAHTHYEEYFKRKKRKTKARIKKQ